MGARLGRYVVLKHLVSGGMADVLLGRTEGIEGFERHVVLKRIRPEHAKDHRFIRMFLDEARVAANLHHQHIVQVHDVGESSGEYFIAMEYIHGEDVRTILSMASKTRAHVPLGHAIAIVSAAAAGLHYAHERRGSDKRPLGIVHRDVSPSNVLVGYDGSIKVVDFGIAKAAKQQETRSGMLKGKVSYMSPEQCRSDDIDRRSDVYSLGVVLYELATTTRLFKGDNDYLVMDQIVNGRVSLPRVRRPDLPNELSTIIMRALAPDPERRYFTADELRVALEQFAGKAGLTASTSQIAAYMRKQFGEKPEPWLDIGGAQDDIPTPVGGPIRNSWTEVPNSDVGIRASGPIARPSGQGNANGANGASQPAPEAAVLHDSAPRTPVTRLPSSPPPTDSKMGWERQPSARGPRGITPAKIAMISAPLVLILGFAIWRLAGTGNTISPTAALANRTITTPAPAPMVTPIPDPVPPPTAIAAAPAGTSGAKVVERTPDPAAAAQSSKRSAASATLKKAGSAPDAKPETKSGTKPEAKPETKIDIKPNTKIDEKPGTQPGAQPGMKPGMKIDAPATTPPTMPGTAASGASGTSTQSTTPTTPAPATATPPPPGAASAPPSASTGTPAAPGATPPIPPVPSAAASPVAVPPAPPADAAPPQLSQAMVNRIAADHSRELSKCDGGDELHGEITIKFMVDASGKVTKPQLATGIKGKTKVTSCILQSVQGWRFPKQGATGAQGTYTLSFQ